MPTVGATPRALQPDTQPSTTTLPPLLISTLSPNRYLAAHLTRTPPIRPSGRLPHDFNPLAITTSSLQSCLGSSVVRAGSTSIVCGIQPELLYTSSIADAPAQRRRTTSQGGPNADARAQRRHNAEDMAQLGLLVPNIDLNTGCAARFTAGQPPGAFAQAVNQRLYRLLLASGLVDLDELRIRRRKDGVEEEVGAGREADNDEEEQEETVAYYALHITLLPLSLSSTSSLLSAAFTAVIAALRDLRLPRAYWDIEREIVVCSDVAADARGLTLRGAPVCCVWGVYEGMRGIGEDQDEDEYGEEQVEEGDRQEKGHGRRWYLADPDALEEEACRESVSLVVDCSGGGAGKNKARFLRIEKSGGGAVGREELKELLPHAETRWKEVVAAMPRARAV